MWTGALLWARLERTARHAERHGEQGPQDPVNLGEVFYLDNLAIGELAWRFTTVSKQGAR